jgi:hypothetical protein
MRAGHGATLLPGQGRVVDDPAESVSTHHGGHDLTADEDAAQIRRQDGVPLVIGDVEEALTDGDPGVVNQDVDPAPLRRDGCHSGHEVRPLPHVEAHPDRRAPRRIELLSDGRSVLGAVARHHHARSAREQPGGDVASDSLCTPGDESDPVR